MSKRGTRFKDGRKVAWCLTPVANFTKKNLEGLIKKWHNITTCASLHEWLGLTFEEYGLFVTDEKKFWKTVVKQKQKEARLVESRKEKRS